MMWDEVEEEEKKENIRSKCILVGLLVSPRINLSTLICWSVLLTDV